MMALAVLKIAAQSLGGTANSTGITLGDIDGDGDLDMVVANYFGANKVYTNDGSGSFEDSGSNAWR